MPRRAVLALAAFALTALLLPACDSTCAGCGGDDMRTTVLGSPDEPTPLGFTAADLVASVAGEYAGTLTWIARPDVTMTPAPGATDLTLTLSYAGGEARLLEPREGGSGRPSYLEVEGVLGLATADGALAETLPATIIGGSLAEPVAAVAFEPASLAGTFRASLPDPSFTVRVNLDLTFAGGAATGDFMVSGTKQEGGVGQGVGLALPIAELATTRTP